MSLGSLGSVMSNGSKGAVMGAPGADVRLVIPVMTLAAAAVAGAAWLSTKH